MPGVTVAIEGTEPIRMRAASALLADHRIHRIGLIGRKPPKSWGDRVVGIESAAGWEVAVGVSAAGVTEVTMGPEGDVTWAGPTGLVRSLGAGMGDDVRLAGTVSGEPIDGEARIAFPPPLGWVGGELVDGVYHCPVRGSLSAVMATSDAGRSLVVLDDRQFLDAALLAAGVILAAEGHRGPVWEAADRYLAVIGDFGLVLADSAAA